MNTSLMLLLCALVVGLIAWGAAQVFDREPPPTLARYFLAKVLPVAIMGLALGIAVASLIIFFEG